MRIMKDADPEEFIVLLVIFFIASFFHPGFIILFVINLILFLIQLDYK